MICVGMRGFKSMLETHNKYSCVFVCVFLKKKLKNFMFEMEKGH